MWVVKRLHLGKENERYTHYESNEINFGRAWYRAMQFSQVIDGVEGALIVIESPDGHEAVVATYLNGHWNAF